MSKTPEKPSRSEFAEFQELTRKLVSVPKAEADKLAAKREQEKPAKQKKGQPKG
jgi:hypothetical protein